MMIANSVAPCSRMRFLVLTTLAVSIIGSHVSSSTTSPKLRPALPVDCLRISAHISNQGILVVDRRESSQSTLESGPFVPSSVTGLAVQCLRGGAADEGTQHQKYERNGHHHEFGKNIARERREQNYNQYGDHGRQKQLLSQDYGRFEGKRAISESWRNTQELYVEKERQNRHRDHGRQYYRYEDDKMYNRTGHAGGRWEHGHHDGRIHRQHESFRNDADLNSGEKSGSESWFRKKKPPNTDDFVMDREDIGKQSPRGSSSIPPPPPPPPQSPGTLSSTIDINPAATERTPIHYLFPTTEAAAEQRLRSDEKLDDMTSSGNIDTVSSYEMFDVDDDMFRERRESVREQRPRRMKKSETEFASPRKDEVTLFMSSKSGASKVRFGSAVVGAAFGAFLGKSLMNDPLLLSMITSTLLFITSFLRNAYGELSRALGLAFLVTLKRTGSVRKDYPTLPHLKALIRQGPRKPFPPVEEGSSPWKYEPIYEDDPEFRMTFCLLAMVLVGTFCGGNVPLIPAWMGGVTGAVAFASLTSGINAHGDLWRSMGMRVVGLVQIVLAVNAELQILSKTATVGGLIFDKLMILDRKHRIKDKIVAVCRWGYEKVSGTASQIQADIQEERR